MDRREGSDRAASADRPTGERTTPEDRTASGTASATQSFYDRWARLYDPIARWTPGIRTVRRSVAAACRLAPGDTVVELGCGTGANLPHLRERVGPTGTVIGVDVTPGVLRLARRHTAPHDNVHVVRGDATRPPLDASGDDVDADASDVDAIVATFLVGMLPDPADAVSTWCTLVGPGGRVVLANATPTDHWSAPLLNRAFRLFVVGSTPPASKLDYDEDLVARLDDRVDAAHRRLHDRSRAAIDAEHALGLVRLTGGIVGDADRR